MVSMTADAIWAEDIGELSEDKMETHEVVRSLTVENWTWLFQMTLKYSKSAVPGGIFPLMWQNTLHLLAH